MLKKTLKKFPKKLQRPDKDETIDLEIWKPKWNCFCCHDNGIINLRLAKLVLEDYDHNKDKFPKCQATKCKAGQHYNSPNLFDSVNYDIDPETCNELDKKERDYWNDTVFDKHQNIVNKLAKDFNMREKDRSQLEQEQAEQNHEFWQDF